MNIFCDYFMFSQGLLPASVFIQSVTVETLLNLHGTDSVMREQLTQC